MLERAALSRQTTRGSVTLSGSREQVGVERDGIAPVVGRTVFLVVSSIPLNSKSLIANKKKGNVPEDDISL
jgi:hypothetical protein